MHLVAVPLLLFALLCVRNAGADVITGPTWLVFVDAALGLAALAVVGWIVVRWQA